MRDNFDACLAEVLKHEGGWADHPSDPGGATMKGITIGTFSRYKRRDVSKAELRAISDADVERIYRGEYWDKVRGDDLPAGLDLVAFDGAVNSGPARGARWLQAGIGVEQDGKVGAITIKAAHDCPDKAAAIRTACAVRLNFLRGLKTWPTFGRGWQRRVTEVEAVALRMLGKPASAPVAPPVAPPRPSPAPDFPAAAPALPAWLARIIAFFRGKGA